MVRDAIATPVSRLIEYAIETWPQSVSPPRWSSNKRERFESIYTAQTGDQSYGRAHTATNDAGYTWDPEAAARDGFGYQRRDLN